VELKSGQLTIVVVGSTPASPRRSPVAFLFAVVVQERKKMKLES
jgi:hypothetical protein